MPTKQQLLQQITELRQSQLNDGDFITRIQNALHTAEMRIIDLENDSEYMQKRYSQLRERLEQAQATLTLNRKCYL